MATPSHDGSSVQVAVRVRPMLSFEGGSTQCIEVLRNPSAGDCPNVIRIGGEKGPTFCFDEAFPPETSQQEVYDHRVSPLVASCLEGYNATTLAYGQTGSGKTFSMTGPTTTMQDGSHAGIIPRAIQSLFDQLIKTKTQRSSQESTYDFVVHIQFLELYGEEIRDLLTTKLNPEKLVIRDIGLEEPEVLGATQLKVDGPEHAMLCLARGMLRRVTGSTAMNAESSRSHAILSLHVEQSTTTTDGRVSVVRSKFHFVDLAGSERQKRTQAVGQRLKEGIDINKGLFVLGNVISALGDPTKAGKTFVPYRDSKLTRLLKGSLGGNHKTLMIACVSPSSSNLEESLNCLRYANRAKNIQNNAVVNVDAGTRLVLELRSQVAAFAAELLRIKLGGNPLIDTYSTEMLQDLAAGGGDIGIGGIPGEAAASRRATERGSHLLRSLIEPDTPGLPDNPRSVRLQHAENELAHARLVLTRTTDELKSAHDDLFAVRAERELYRLGFEANGALEIETAFLEKAADYEREIATLQGAIQASSYSTAPGDEVSAAAITQPSRLFPRETKHTKGSQGNSERSFNGSPDSQDENDDLEMDQLRFQVLQSMSPGAQLEAEEKAAEEELSSLTKIFLNDDDEIDGSDSVNSGCSTKLDQAIHKKLEVDLMDLSRSIDAKESLIHQLQLSQKKYESMRDFYEEKLKQMEVQVKERESEREALLTELNNSENSPRTREDPRTKELEEKLRDKERHIAGLKKRQCELMNLTGVSSRNEREMNRLKNDIVSMKAQKVELQKLISAERKSHTNEINRMKKDLLHHDKEATKWKRISEQKAVEAEKSHLVAKSRLEQIGTLRAKYSNVEKQLRLKTVKRGVMEKAGLDSIIVGRRSTKRKSEGFTALKGDVDAVRDFLDKKVASIGKKEAIADKLAHEWEDHLELLAKKEKLGKTRSAKQARQSIDVELKYKEERIRKLAEQLGKQPDTASKNVDVICFDEDNEFRKLLPEVSTMPGMKLISRILFGMVVRERRRVATLVRAASNLNERVKSAEHQAAEVDSAFRAYQDEERIERVALANSQQLQILSLMEMVREDTAKSGPTIMMDADAHGQSLSPLSMTIPGDAQGNGVTSRLALLASERVEALERELEELRGEMQSMERYKVMEAETRAELCAKNDMLDRLTLESQHLRYTLRHVRSRLSAGGMAEEMMRDFVLNVVSDGLEYQSNAKGRNTGLAEQDKGSESLRLVSIESDSDEEEIPEWAGDIMADLAVIAEGHIPECLLATIRDKASPNDNDKGTVFDRLTNPNNFTGVQKRKTEESVSRSMQVRTRKTSKESNNLEDKQEGKRVAFQKVPEPLGDLNQHRERETASLCADLGKKYRDDKDDGAESRSVFERLLSPSSYTGTQKEKLQVVQARRNQKAEEALDGILSNDHQTASPSSSLQVAHVKEIETVDITALVASKVSEYTQKDVFERLQSHTTQSYAVKHSQVPLHRPMATPLYVENEVSIKVDPFVTVRSKEPIALSPLRDRSVYTQQNVFERLQRTKTHAFAGKELSRYEED